MNKSTPLSPASSSQPSETFSIDFLCKLVPTGFDGNRYELGQFLANCNNAFEIASESQKTALLYYVLARITGRAKDQLNHQSFTNWEELKEILNSLYKGKKHNCQLMEELNNARQGKHESVNDYYQRHELLSSRALNATRQYTSDPSLVPGKLEAGLKTQPSIDLFIIRIPRSHMESLQILNSAFAAAVSEERALNIHKRRQKWCQNCKRTGHETETCRSKSGTNPKPVHIAQEKEKFCNYCKNEGPFD